MRAFPEKHDRVLVYGCGVIGLLTIQALKALAPQAKITALARHQFQAELAGRYGADAVYQNRDIFEIASSMTGKKIYQGMGKSKMILDGFDLIYDCIGNQKSINDSLRCVRAQGKVVLVGIDMNYQKIDLNPVWYQEISIVGVCGHGKERYDIGKGLPSADSQINTFDLAAALFKQKRLTTEGLITHRFALKEWKKAIKTATDKKGARAVKVALEP